jgi:hypothetical protein
MAQHLGRSAPNPPWVIFLCFSWFRFPPTNDPDLQALWQAQADQLSDPEPPSDIKDLANQFLVLVTCRDEKEQVELIARLKEEGRECKALLA